MRFFPLLSLTQQQQQQQIRESAECASLLSTNDSEQHTTNTGVILNVQKIQNKKVKTCTKE